MKLRYRLFIWVSGIFFIAFSSSFFLEERITRISLKNIYQDFIKELNIANNKKTRQLEEYLSEILFRIQAQVDSVLKSIEQFETVRQGFEPTIYNLKEMNWLDSASLLVTNKWINFIHSTNEESVMSQIILDREILHRSYIFSINKDLTLIAVQDEKGEWSQPFIGIDVNISSRHFKDKEERRKHESDEKYFAFFTLESILNLDPKVEHEAIDISVNFLEPYIKWMKVPYEEFFFDDFFKKIKNTKNYLNTHPEIIPSDVSWKKMIEEKDKEVKEKDLIHCYPYGSIQNNLGQIDNQDFSISRDYSLSIQYYLNQFTMFYKKVGMIWGLSMLTHSDIFGDSPLSLSSPTGLGVVYVDGTCGQVLLSKHVFFEESKYNVKEKFKDVDLHPLYFLKTHLDIIAPKGSKKIFFGNTIKLQSDDNGTVRNGYLTIGADGTKVLSDLARSIDKTVVFVSKEKILAAVDPKGNEIADNRWFALPISELLIQDQGIISIENKEYYFLRISPYKELDLHFFVFTDKEEEFALLNSLNTESEKVIRTISRQMRFTALGCLIFVLICLNNIASRITKPISALVLASKNVAEGHLEDIQISNLRKANKKDEITVLYNAFFDMVKGLKEKEKVRGVLNKVVSKEIAEETLKGHIQLGGEKKHVTVFFADIRHFTSMTEKMDPKQVINIVNKCMTKVSNLIDLHGGVIDKYVGDEVMALFGAPIQKEHSVVNAIKCAVDIVESLKKSNQNNEEIPIEMGIGIHTGTVVAGNMGAENRLNYTVLGSNVNLAARLCSEADPMQILISEDTLHEKGVKERIEVEQLKQVDLKGFSQPISVYLVKDIKKHSDS